MSYFFISCLFLFVLFLFVSRLFPKLTAEEKTKSANNTPPVKYDVFVSFRGDDIRQGFLSHLIDTFKRKQVKAFVDDELVRGDEIWPSLVQAIEGSFISLIIFSQNYASSRWCLEELVTILKCREKHGQTVIPVFYHVKPTHVRHQSESYENAFAEHGRRYKNKVQTWRQALNISADLSGIESSTNDAELLKDIVDLVLTRLGKHAVNLNGLVGIDTKIADVESLICKHKDSKDIRLIGIWGMGGIGKTTLAEQVFNKLRVDDKYDGYSFLANERQQASKHGIIILKERIFSELLGNAVKIATENSLPNDVVRRIGRMKVLIVLDDVNDSDHLEKLLGTPDNFGSGSRIIVTTRDEQVLNANNADETYKLTELSFDKALELFNLNAFSKSDCQREHDDLTKRVVDYAKGVPLVLKVLAHHLRKKEKEVWESQLYKLKKTPLRKIYDVMKLSFEDLDRKEQQIFLDLACFFLRAREQLDVGDLKSLLKDSGSDVSVAAGLEKLKDKALITVSEDNFVSMHDSLQEMAWEIVRQESDNPGSRSRLWDPDDVYEALENNKGTEAVRSIQIELITIENLKLSPHVFSKMSRLRFLEVWDHEDYFDQDPTLAKRLQYLATDLRFLDWWGYPLKSLPENFSTEKLVILRLVCSQLEKLWDGAKNLVNLKELDLSDSCMLEELPDLSQATNLKALVLNNCSSLQILPELPQVLEVLHAYNCESLQTLPKLPQFLETLTVAGCSSLQTLPKLPPCLKDLEVGNFSSMKPLPKLPQCLETLNVQDCMSILTLVELPSCLKDLTVIRCESLKTLPKLPQFLEILNVRYCSSLQILPELPPRLKYLNIQYCVSVKTLPELSQFLETLDVNHCSSLQTLPELPPFLKYLDVGYCESMKTLPELPPFLKYLCAELSESMETLPELPPFLKTLNVAGCDSLQTLPELPLFLETLNVSYCFSLQILPVLPPSLKFLRTGSCISLQTLLNLPPSLKTLNFKKCKSLQTLPELPPHLVALEAKTCDSLQTLPELPHFLETLDIRCCTSLKTVSFSKIVQELRKSGKHVSFWNCPSLDESSLVAIGLDARINMMKSANQYLSSGNPLDAENYDDFRNYQAVYVYPGSNVLKWLEYKTTNDFIIVDLSSAAPPSPSFGFIFCFVLGKYNETGIYGHQFKITVGDVEGEGEKESVTMDTFYSGSKIEEIELDHVCIMYDQRCSVFLNRIAKKQTRFKIEVTMWINSWPSRYTSDDDLQQALIKGFGVSPISTSTYNSFIQQMELSGVCIIPEK